MNKRKGKYESVKIETEVMDRVRKYVAQSRQTISGFISSELESVLDSREDTVPTKESNNKKK